MTKRIRPEPLDESDIADIRRYLPLHGTRWVAEYLGCAESTVRKHATKLGIELQPKTAPRRTEVMR